MGEGHALRQLSYDQRAELLDKIADVTGCQSRMSIFGISRARIREQQHKPMLSLLLMCWTAPSYLSPRSSKIEKKKKKTLEGGREKNVLKGIEGSGTPRSALKNRSVLWRGEVGKTHFRNAVERRQMLKSITVRPPPAVCVSSMLPISPLGAWVS